jgi:2-dehydro-3-deoxy-D-gluconate 5-dehydrogenase
MTQPATPFDLTGKVALVTGASVGLGAGMAIGLAAAGADVVCHGIVPVDDTMAAIKALGRRTAAVIGDLSDKATPNQVIAEAEHALGPVDILINNAGIIRRAPAHEHPDEYWDQVIAVNLSAVFRMCREMGRRWIERGSHGKIVNVASLLAFQGGILVPGYAAAKGGVAQITKSFANEWAARGINVNAVAPGYMATDNTAPLRADDNRSRQILERIPAGRWGTPEDLAGAAVFLCAPASDYINGHVLVVDGGWMAR